MKMTGMMTTTEDLFEEDTPVTELIATKLWWGWVPRVSNRKWFIPFEGKVGRHEPMTKEEQQWFRSH